MKRWLCKTTQLSQQDGKSDKQDDDTSANERMIVLPALTLEEPKRAVSSITVPRAKQEADDELDPPASTHSSHVSYAG